MAVKELISTVTVGASGASSIDFTNIPQGFTDVLIVASTRASAGAIARNMNVRFNGNTSGYSEQMMDSNGATPSSASTSGSLINWSLEADSAATANTFSNVSLYIPNYSSSVAYKTMSIDSSSENNATTAYNRLTAGLWANNAPITTVSLLAEAGSSFVQYSTASLYGIRKGADAVTIVNGAGGTVTTSGGYTYHTFTSSGTFVANRTLNADILVIAGGGGGLSGNGSGGGAGGLQGFTNQVLTPDSYAVIVGAGGASGYQGTAANGSNSRFGSLASSIGGGCGDPYAGRNGGSGGGGGDQGRINSPGGYGTNGQGFAGGTGSSYAGGGYNSTGGGGGGAGAAGGDAGGLGGVAGVGGAGSSAYSTWATATSTGVGGLYAGGGGGGANNLGTITKGAGGSGGGGAGGGSLYPSDVNGVAGTANTGSGGGGGGGQASVGNGNGGNGGSGIVIIRYLTPA